MAAFLLIMVGMILCFSGISYLVSLLVAADSWKYDMTYLWDFYDVTPEQMGFSDE